MQWSRVMRDLALIVILFVLAVLVGVMITPLMSIVFVIVARILISLWHDARQSYNAEMSLLHQKPKRTHILTADGDRLEVTAAEDTDEPRRFSTQD